MLPTKQVLRRKYALEQVIPRNLLLQTHTFAEYHLFLESNFRFKNLTI